MSDTKDVKWTTWGIEIDGHLLGFGPAHGEPYLHKSHHEAFHWRRRNRLKGRVVRVEMTAHVSEYQPKMEPGE